METPNNNTYKITITHEDLGHLIEAKANAAFMAGVFYAINQLVTPLVVNHLHDRDYNAKLLQRVKTITEDMNKFNPETLSASAPPRES